MFSVKCSDLNSQDVSISDFFLFSLFLVFLVIGVFYSKFYMFLGEDALFYHSQVLMQQAYGVGFLPAVQPNLASAMSPNVLPIHPVLSFPYFILGFDKSSATSYVFVGLSLYLSVYSFSRVVGFNRLVACISGFFLVLFFLPIVPALSLDVIGLIHPNVPWLVSVGLLVSSLILILDRVKTSRFTLNGIVKIIFVFVFLYFFLVSDMIYASILLPAFIFILFGGLFLSRSFLFYLAIFVFFVVSAKLLLFFDNLSVFSAFSYRAANLVTWSAAFKSYMVSSIFNEGWVKFFQGGEGVRLGIYPLLTPFIGFGALVFIVMHSTVSKFWWPILFFILGLHIASHEFLDDGARWPWPAPGYYEWGVYPIYAIMWADAIVRVGKSAIGCISRRSVSFKVEHIYFRRSMLVSSGVLALIACGVYSLKVEWNMTPYVWRLYNPGHQYSDAVRRMKAGDNGDWGLMPPSSDKFSYSIDAYVSAGLQARSFFDHNQQVNLASALMGAVFYYLDKNKNIFVDNYWPSSLDKSDARGSDGDDLIYRRQALAVENFPFILKEIEGKQYQNLLLIDRRWTLSRLRGVRAPSADMISLLEKPFLSTSFGGKVKPEIVNQQAVFKLKNSKDEPLLAILPAAYSHCWVGGDTAPVNGMQLAVRLSAGQSIQISFERDLTKALACLRHDIAYYRGISSVGPTRDDVQKMPPLTRVMFELYRITVRRQLDKAFNEKL